MKKILCLAMTAVMLLSVFTFTVSAKGSVIFSDTFDKGFLPKNWITDPGSCRFKWDSDNQCIYEYDNAKVLQSNYGRFGKWWDQFYASFDVQIRDFYDLSEYGGTAHTISLWYRDRMESKDNMGAVYTFTLDVETGYCTLVKEHEWKYYDENGVMADAYTKAVLSEATIEDFKMEIGDNAPWYEIGIRITEGKIECYFEQKLIISAEVDPEEPKLGDYTMNSVDASVGSMKSAVLFLNSGNYLALDNFYVRTPDYDFVDVIFGDVNGDEKINLADVTKVLQYIAKWELADFNKDAADVNADGKINLSDATKMLKYIAKWENINLGYAD